MKKKQSLVTCQIHASVSLFPTVSYTIKRDKKSTFIIFFNVTFDGHEQKPS